MSPRHRNLVLGIALTVLAIGGAAALALSSARRHAIEGTMRGESCASCHTSATHQGPHARQACVACHTVDEAAAAGLFWSSHGVGEAPTHGRTPEGSCGGCHEEPTLAATGHRGHAVVGECSSCHQDPHGAEPTRSCESCHAGTARHGVAADVDCTTCHLFRSAPITGALEPTAGLAGVGHDSAFGTRLHGAMDCRRCHDPHRETQTPVGCDTCHRGAIAEQRASAPIVHRECNDCHHPHAAREQRAFDCLACHVTPVGRQGWEARREGVSEEDRQRTRERLTHEGRCGTCHAPHTWTATEARCSECHAENARTVAALPADSHRGCVGCHEPHSPRPDASLCQSCHQSMRVSSVANPPAHRNCLSCHQAHEGRPEPTATCASCHRSTQAETARRPAPHQACLSCHQQHGPPREPTRESCAGCHAEVARLFVGASAPAAHACASCHAPHAFAAGAAAVTRCASCHVDAVAPEASHRGSCTSCHQGHGEPRGRANDCRSCHAEVRAAVGGHSDCTSCHRPHLPAATARAACQSCHAEPAAVAASWPATSAHARQQCSSCHRPHAEAQRASCESCHSSQMSRTHTGGHDRCIGCHQPHRAPPVAPQTWWSRCGSCHTDQAAAAARSTGTHARCSGCHQTPGPPLPTCASCHASTPRRLAHQHHASERCTSCHATHGPSQIVRATCTSCHQDRTDHFPDAQRCQSCHSFAQ